MQLTRRHVLAASALVAGASLAGVGGTAWRWWDQPAGAGFQVLSPDEAAFFDALAEAIFPTGGEPALGGGAAGVSHYVDNVLQGMHPTQRDLLRLAVHAFDNLARAAHGSAFSELPTAQATEVLLGWSTHERFEIRGVTQSFYIFAVMAYLVHPDVAPGVATSFRCGFGL